MKLLTLTMRNFRQYKDNTLEFGAGLIGIFGANGSGKSTILEAIAWVLYGRLRAGAKNDTVRCRVSEGGSSVYVSLEFELDGEIYKVERSMSGKTNKADASLSVGSIVTATSVKEVNEKIENLFRMDYHAFFTGFFTNQKDIEFMGGKNSTERVTEICKMLGYERIIDARKKANDDYRHAVSTVKALDDIMADPAEIEKEIAEKKAALGESEKSLKAAEESFERAKKALAEAEPRKKAADEAKGTYDKLVNDDNVA
ncbi:MAG: SMC family ATPase, partial [Abditibacteriota bacterium]|nr:SMC family ATPase [Abditibacteriota bacterium]